PARDRKALRQWDRSEGISETTSPEPHEEKEGPGCEAGPRAPRAPDLQADVGEARRFGIQGNGNRRGGGNPASHYQAAPEDGRAGFQQTEKAGPSRHDFRLQLSRRVRLGGRGGLTNCS